MNVNVDVGEGASEEEAVLLCADSANVCCGVHAGSRAVTVATVQRCIELGIEVGAHPGYDDRGSFGRVEIPLSERELEALIAPQLAVVAAVTRIAYVKAHGALYHYCQREPRAADALARVTAAHGAGLVGQPGREILAAAARAGIPGYREGFADRLLLPDGGLAPRSEPGAVLPAERAAEQAVALARSGEVDTICVHGDSPGASRIAAAVRQALREAGVQTGPLAG